MDAMFFLTASAIVIVALSFGEQEYRRKVLERRVVARPVLARQPHGYGQPGTRPGVDTACSLRRTR
jgi:hypothetical protein